jgi:hypothetical protein
MDASLAEIANAGGLILSVPSGCAVDAPSTIGLTSSKSAK